MLVNIHFHFHTCSCFVSSFFIAYITALTVFAAYIKKNGTLFKMKNSHYKSYITLLTMQYFD